MQGMLFAVIDPKGRLLSTGKVMARITPTNYLCKFKSMPVQSRIVPIEELRNYLLFDDINEINNFIAITQQPAEDPEDDNEPDDEDEPDSGYEISDPDQ